MRDVDDPFVRTVVWNHETIFPGNHARGSIRAGTAYQGEDPGIDAPTHEVTIGLGKNSWERRGVHHGARANPRKGALCLDKADWQEANRPV